MGEYTHIHFLKHEKRPNIYYHVWKHSDIEKCNIKEIFFKKKKNMRCLVDEGVRSAQLTVLCKHLHYPEASHTYGLPARCVTLAWVVSASFLIQMLCKWCKACVPDNLDNSLSTVLTERAGLHDSPRWSASKEQKKFHNWFAVCWDTLNVQLQLLPNPSIPPLLCFCPLKKKKEIPTVVGFICLVV